MLATVPCSATPRGRMSKIQARDSISGCDHLLIESRIQLSRAVSPCLSRTLSLQASRRIWPSYLRALSALYPIVISLYHAAGRSLGQLDSVLFICNKLVHL